MIITLKKDAPKAEVEKLIHTFENKGLSVTMIQGDNYNVFGLVGDTSKIDEKLVKAHPFVENVTRIAAPYKKANRLFHPADTIVDVAGIKVGGNEKIVVIGGPCSVEGDTQIMDIAKEVKNASGDMLRGGAYKPRTSPYAFQGMGTEGVKCMVHARETYGLPIVSELMSADKIDEFVEHVDLIQIGARNMQNFVRNAQDLITVKEALKSIGNPDLQVYAKIENMEGVAHLKELFPYCDQIVIARGDLGNAMPLWELPAVQKRIQDICRVHSMPYMVVTQMLDSMMEHPVPTRAEVSDIFHAVYHGASSIMLTGETAAGKYPREAMKYFSETAKSALVCREEVL